MADSPQPPARPYKRQSAPLRPHGEGSGDVKRGIEQDTPPKGQRTPSPTVASSAAAQGVTRPSARSSQNKPAAPAGKASGPLKLRSRRIPNETLEGWLKVIGRFEWVFAGLMVVLVFSFLILYGMTIQTESAIGKLSQETRSMEEHNKGLQSDMVRIQSFEKVSDLAARVPHLTHPEERFEARHQAAGKLPQQRPREPLPFIAPAGY